MIGEIAFSYDLGRGAQVAIYHPSARRSAHAVVFVVGGGPQYRVGGHRQLVQWARALSLAGHHVLRFDSPGMGDSHGDHAGFETLGEQIRAAIDQIALRVPDLEEITLWGECEAASAIVFYGHLDPRVTRMVLLNPWARTEQGQARTVIRHYYLQRLREPSFWRKLLGLRLDLREVSRSGLANLRLALRGNLSAAAARKPAGGAGEIAPALPLPERLRQGLERFGGPVLLVMSGRDHIAKEFDTAVAGSRRWRRLMARKRLERLDLPEADHTFSSGADKRAVAAHAIAWLQRQAQVDASRPRPPARDLAPRHLHRPASP